MLVAQCPKQFTHAARFELSHRTAVGPAIEARFGSGCAKRPLATGGRAVQIFQAGPYVRICDIPKRIVSYPFRYVDMRIILAAVLSR